MIVHGYSFRHKESDGLSSQILFLRDMKYLSDATREKNPSDATTMAMTTGRSISSQTTTEKMSMNPQSPSTESTILSPKSDATTTAMTEKSSQISTRSSISSTTTIGKMSTKPRDNIRNCVEKKHFDRNNFLFILITILWSL